MLSYESMNSLLKYIAPKCFNEGQRECQNLGKNLVSHQKINNFLDLGCSDGKFTLEFARSFNPEKIYGLDISKSHCLTARKNGVNCKKHDLNHKFPYKNALFDLILSSQNIEHLYNTRAYLEECYRCLKPDGQIIILTENLASWPNIFSLVFGWQPFSTTNINGFSLGNPLIWHLDQQKSSCKDGHIRVLTPKGLSDLLKKTGFEKIKIQTKCYPPFWGSVSNFLCSIDRYHGHFLIANAFKPAHLGQ